MRARISLSRVRVGYLFEAEWTFLVLCGRRPIMRVTLWIPFLIFRPLEPGNRSDAISASWREGSNDGSVLTASRTTFHFPATDSAPRIFRLAIHTL